jgi:hypothetical protein
MPCTAFSSKFNAAGEVRERRTYAGTRITRCAEWYIC